MKRRGKNRLRKTKRTGARRGSAQRFRLLGSITSLAAKLCAVFTGRPVLTEASRHQIQLLITAMKADAPAMTALLAQSWTAVESVRGSLPGAIAAAKMARRLYTCAEGSISRIEP